MTRYVSNEVFLIESGYLWALITSIVIRPPIKPARSAVTGSSSHSCQTRQRIRAVLFKQIPPVIPRPSHQRHPSPNKLEPLSVRRPLIVPINLRRSWIAEWLKSIDTANKREPLLLPDNGPFRPLDSSTLGCRVWTKRPYFQRWTESWWVLVLYCCNYSLISENMGLK